MKKLIALFILMFVFSSISFSQSFVQSGTWSINPSVSGYNLDKGNGDRSMTIDIEFPKPFESKPTVVLSVSQIDTDKDTNSRYNIEAISVSRDGFTLKVRTWADSKVYSMSGYWIAYTNK
ncbi:MAG: H-type lectin domain-containing protein [Ignavibacterium sp.]|nr:H-type lectin domain-containing protein [Ignavibacterium sp.]